MRLRDRLIKGTALNFIAVAFNQGSTLIVNIIVARILMKEAFGEYAMVQSTLLTAASLSQFATGYTATKYIAEYRTSDPQRAGRIMGMCTLVSALMAGVGVFLLFAMAPWLAESMLKAPHLAVALMIGSGFLFFSSINGYQIGALSGLEAYGGLAKAGVASGIVTVAAITIGAWWGGLNGTLVGLSTSAFVRCALHGRWLCIESLVRDITPHYRGSLSQEKAIVFKFALPAVVAGYYSYPMFWLANSFLVSQPGGYGEMALYAAAVNIKGFALYAPGIINGVVSSILNHMKGIDNLQSYNHLYKFNILLTFIITLTIALILSIFGKFFLGMFGNDFVTAKTILLVVLVSSVLETTGGAIHQYIQNHGKMWLSFFFINLPIIFIFVVVAYFAVPMLGALGLGVASVTMTIIQLLATVILSCYIKRTA